MTLSHFFWFTHILALYYSPSPHFTSIVIYIFSLVFQVVPFQQISLLKSYMRSLPHHNLFNLKSPSGVILSQGIHFLYICLCTWMCIISLGFNWHCMKLCCMLFIIVNISLRQHSVTTELWHFNNSAMNSWLRTHHNFKNCFKLDKS